MRNKVAGSTGEEKVEVWNKSHESMSLIISEIRIKMFFLENSIILILRKIFQLEDDIFKAILSRNTTKIGTNPLVGGNRAESQNLVNDRGDVPGWVLVVLMTAGPDFPLDQQSWRCIRLMAGKCFRNKEGVPAVRIMDLDWLDAPDARRFCLVRHQLAVANIEPERSVATHPHAPLARGSELVADALADHLTFELGETEQDVQCKPSHRRRGVEGLRYRDEGHSVPFKFLHEFQEVDQRT